MKHLLNRSLLLSMLLAALGGGAAYLALARAGGGTESDGARVVQIARPVAVGQRFTAADVESRAVPAVAVPDGAVRTAEEVVGRYATFPMLKGEVVLQQKVSERAPGSNLAALIPPGRVAISVAVSEVVSTGRFIAPGDAVDVLGVISKDAGGRAEVVLRDVMVLAVASSLIGAEPAEQQKQRTGTRDNPKSLDATVTLAVTVEEAQRLVQVDEIGRLRLALRSSTESSVRQSLQSQ